MGFFSKKSSKPTGVTEFIPGAGACIASANVVSQAGRIKWMVREPSHNPADNGWRIFSDIDTDEYLADSANMQVADFNRLCEIEPALIGIWDQPVGSDLQIVDEGTGIKIVHTVSGQQIPNADLYNPVS